mmetsp:Transcript_762/g.1559  ORF Transcript_762/g.1559 Transcript_762/m.1559 type:complete len:146 (+) Transcript_762:4179-4616(+)
MAETRRVREHWLSYYSNHVVGNWGGPLKIVSDRGPQLVGDAYQSMCRSLSIRPNVSTAESPQTNGLVERTNQLVTHVMRKRWMSFGEEWDEYLYAAMFAINDSPREAIGGYTPFQLSTGRSPSLPIGALLLLGPYCCQYCADHRP